MKSKTKFFYIKCFVAVLLAFLMTVTALGMTACGEDTAEKTVTKVEVTKLPTKTTYNAGETFSAEGGELTVKYSDGSSEVVSMTAEGVTFSGNNIVINDDNNTSEKKNVRVTYKEKSDTFQIVVNNVKYTVVFDFGRDGIENKSVEVKSGDKVRALSEDDMPTVEGYTFYNWYADEKYTKAFDFTAPILADTTIYALWLDNSATYYDVTFDLNYTWSPDGDVQKAAEGYSVPRPEDPERKGYNFVGWFTDKDGTTEYNFETTKITANTTIYAKWEISEEYATGTHEYVFEAEDTNLDGKTYPGLSGTASGTGLIQNFEGFGASGDRFVGYQTTEGASVDFIIVSDKAVTDATIVLRLSAELRDMTLSPDTYSVQVNGQALQFEPIEFKNVPQQSGGDVSNLYALPFQDYVIAKNVTLKEGRNNISCIVMNSNQLEGTTILADGPLVDCLKITTSAVLDWSAKNGLPVKDNY